MNDILEVTQLGSTTSPNSRLRAPASLASSAPCSWGPAASGDRLLWLAGPTATMQSCKGRGQGSSGGYRAQLKEKQGRAEESKGEAIGRRDPARAREIKGKAGLGQGSKGGGTGWCWPDEREHFSNSAELRGPGAVGRCSSKEAQNPELPELKGNAGQRDSRSHSQVQTARCHPGRAGPPASWATATRQEPLHWAGRPEALQPSLLRRPQPWQRRPPQEAASFVLQTEAPILCSESMCSKDKPQENSCCLLTLTIRIAGKWSKQEMTNVFGDQEEVMAEVAAS